MAERGLGATALANIRAGMVAFKQNLREKAETSNLSGLIRDLRRLPVADRDKKRELAAFFQMEEGTRYTREDRHKAYNAVLGVDRNRRQRG